MLILLSPSKNQNFNTSSNCESFSIPIYLKEAGELIELLRSYSESELSDLLKTNTKLTRQNFDRLFMWKLPFDKSNAKSSVLAFDGEVFRGLHAADFNAGDMEHAQQHLRIFSGLYGILRPLDLIQPYRLEVSSKLSNPSGNDLYPFWRKKVTQHITETIKNAGHSCILNLASAEYFKMTDIKKLTVPVISPEFYEDKSGKLRSVVIYTKRARGLMTRFVIKNSISNQDELQAFNEEGYWFNPTLSTPEKPVFVR
jgi:uncharacterized protein